MNKHQGVMWLASVMPAHWATVRTTMGYDLADTYFGKMLCYFFSFFQLTGMYHEAVPSVIGSRLAGKVFNSKQNEQTSRCDVASLSNVSTLQYSK
jgi:hypothetical protein